MAQVEQVKFLSRKWLAAKREKEHSCWYSNRKRLEVNLSQHPPEWQVVIISSAAALLSRLVKGTGLVSGPLHPHVARLFFFSYLGANRRKQALFTAQLLPFWGSFCLVCYKILYGMSINRARITLARGNSCYDCAWRGRRKIFFQWLPTTSSCFLDKWKNSWCRHMLLSLLIWHY